jgi:hypothetical protein
MDKSLNICGGPREGGVWVKLASDLNIELRGIK